MILEIVYKKDKLEIFDDVNSMSIDDGKVTFDSPLSENYYLSRVLNEGAKVLVDGTVCYEHGKESMDSNNEKNDA